MKRKKWKKLSLEDRRARAHARLAPIAARVGGEVVDDEDDEVAVVGAVEHTQRPFWIRCTLDGDDDDDEGPVYLRMRVANQVGFVELSCLDEDSEPESEYWSVVHGHLAVWGDASERRDGVAVLARLPPEFAPAADRGMRESETDEIKVMAHVLEIGLADLRYGKEDWDDCLSTIEAQVALLAHLATLIERAGPGTDVACRWCGARFVMDAARACPKCGGPL